MRLLEEFLKNYCEEPQPEEAHNEAVTPFVDNVGKGVSTMPTNLQHLEIIDEKHDKVPSNSSFGGQNPKTLALKIPSDFKKLREGKENVDNVACVRGEESAILPPLSQDRGAFEADSGCSLARASDIVDKWGDCDSCPACGYWDGYEFWSMPPGRYCFYSAYFKGKAARPVPIAEARRVCPK
jgi:hypothetical protein